MLYKISSSLSHTYKETMNIDFDLSWASLLEILWKFILAIILLDILVLRLGLFLQGYWYYWKQGVAFVKPVHPIIGCFMTLSKLMNEEPKKEHQPYRPLLENTFGKNIPEVAVCMI